MNNSLVCFFAGIQGAVQFVTTLDVGPAYSNGLGVNSPTRWTRGR